MIKFIQKLLYLWEKKKHLTMVELETQYVIEYFEHILSKDIDEMRGKLEKLAIETKTENIKKEIIELEREINEVVMYRKMVENGNMKKNELENIIKNVKKNLLK